MLTLKQRQERAARRAARIAAMHEAIRQAAAHNEPQYEEKIDDPFELVECGICGAYHRPGYDGDCRDDAERFPHADALRALWRAAPNLMSAAKEVAEALNAADLVYHHGSSDSRGNAGQKVTSAAQYAAVLNAAIASAESA